MVRASKTTEEPLELCQYATPCMGALEAHLLTLCLCRNSWTQGGDSDSAPPVGLPERCCTFRRLNSGGGGHLSPEGTWGWAWQAPRGPALLTVTLVKALRYEGRPVLGGWAPVTGWEGPASHVKDRTCLSRRRSPARFS